MPVGPHYYKVIELLKLGNSNTEVAQILNINPLLVGNIKCAAKRRLDLPIDITVDFELSFDEIAEELGITINQVKTAFRNGLKKIKVSCGDLHLEQYLEQDDITFGDTRTPI